ncbi:hypothetical protein NQ315_011167 [Exocentrus adspersus]|uniref:Cytochrome b5 domain-containing protein 1 n=1 Tax=Exocentrus adspersus TaxID=1586481 RepID=A0AAV8VYA9_9CUCU|nr:hypothetical protein NQ315_011167 [Exocentrus adspersus]
MSSVTKDWPYYAPFEVVVHNAPDDCWVSFLGKVFNITPLLKKYEGDKCTQPLITFAGKDISHWFDEKTGDIQYYIHPETGCRVPYCPHGPIPDVSVEVPATSWKPLRRLPWWQDERYQIGLLTKRVRPVRIVNMMCPKEIVLNVCCEDTFARILQRYLMFNCDAESYTWRYLDRPIIMEKTMEENGIPDERDLFTDLGIPQNYYVPTILLYYNDDLKYINFDDNEEEDICK